MRVITIAALTLALAGCDATYGGAGVSKSGTPYSGEVKTDFGDGGVHVILREPGGTQCKGFAPFNTSGGRQSTTQAPLACNDGQTGQAILTLDNVATRLNVAFKLSGGETGSINFGG